jgi:hypothetical protein
MPKQGYEGLDDPEEASPRDGVSSFDVDGAPAGPTRARALRAVAFSGSTTTRRASAAEDEPVLSLAAEAFAEDRAHKSPMLDGGDLPLRALAQGLSLLSIEELRRLRLPAMPWQATDGPSMWEGLKKTPWKAHYTNVIGFVISTGACVHASRAVKPVLRFWVALRRVALWRAVGGVPPTRAPERGGWTDAARHAGALIAHLWAAVVACMLVVFVSQARRGGDGGARCIATPRAWRLGAPRAPAVHGRRTLRSSAPALRALRRTLTCLSHRCLFGTLTLPHVRSHPFAPSCRPARCPRGMTARWTRR